ncbi:ABC transporter permease [Notoacmeibacter ruber]|uniref:ABC transporter permease n=1 Tax=Notoacmeibacter ruber TaxID=2670375 RepID=A0A3L7JA86_9HYPH|nr:ABC transporter permease [Notoacmeibacter ruber]RLQ87369.1 ABC transporter permease [Notoacmeibacter ruber]
MLSFILNRVMHGVVVMVAVALISFSMISFLGDPVSNMVGQDTTVAQREELRQSLGLNDPLPLQFARFIDNAVRGDFGLSYSLRVPVSELFAERLPATLELSIISAIFAMVIGIPLGIHTAIHRHSLTTQTILTTSLVGVSLPTFLIGILLILIFGVVLRWLPTFGRGEVVMIGGWSTGLLTVSGLRSLILPVATLTIFQLTLIIRLVRAEMMEVLRTDFIKFARARGIRRRSLNYRHALKNTLMPVITVVGLQLGNIIAFSLITESVFQWPGMGLLFVQAIGNADIPVMVAYLMIIALIFVLINLIVDLLLFALDPRLQSSGAK